jgi:hypothetical protein
MAQRLMPAIASLLIRWLRTFFGESLGRAHVNRASHRKRVPGAASEPHCVAPSHDV